jgi:hypothetical protein
MHMGRAPRQAVQDLQLPPQVFFASGKPGTRQRYRARLTPSAGSNSMSTHYVKTGIGQGFAIVHCADIYRFEGWTFEFHRYCGPTLCKGDGEPRKIQPGKRHPFWNALARWEKLSAQQKSETKIYG